MRTTGTLRRVLLVLASSVVASCHSSDALMFHDCQENLFYSDDWTLWDLDLEHDEPRTCPIILDSPGSDYVMVSATIKDGTTSDFFSDRMRMWTSSSSLIVDEPGTFREDLMGQWVVYHAANFRAGSGSNPCYDMLRYEMTERYPGNPGSLPFADGQFDYIYPYSSYPKCP